MDYCVYKLTSPNGKVYIGQTNNFNQRMIEHKNCKKKNKLYNCIRKYGWENFKKEIIGYSETKEMVNELEESLIKLHNATGHKGLNTRLTAEGGDVWVGRYDTEEYMEFVEKMKKSNQSNRMHGKTHKQSTIVEMKKKAKGRFSLEWYIDRNGKEEGTRLYEERRVFLKNRNLPRDKNGNFIKKK